jgi:hypothetical protein
MLGEFELYTSGLWVGERENHAWRGFYGLMPHMQDSNL